MAGCCCNSSGWLGFTVVGIAGVAAGVLGSRALDAGPGPGEVAPGISTTAFAQPEDDADAQMMAEMEKWAAPVAQHEVLKSMVGTWDCKTSFMMGPEPTEGTGVSVMEEVLGGRYVTQHFTMPDMMGKPFEGMGAVGYDKAKGKYVNVWIDSLSTGFATMEGEWDEATKTMTWTGSSAYPDGQGGLIEVPSKHVIKHVGKDSIIMEFWETDPASGEERKGGEIVYTRRK